MGAGIDKGARLRQALVPAVREMRGVGEAGEGNGEEQKWPGEQESRGALDGETRCDRVGTGKGHTATGAVGECDLV